MEQKPDNDMALPATFTCRDCLSFKRCEGFLGIRGDERTCDWAPSRFRLDAIGALCRLLSEADATVTLYGQPVTEGELRHFATTLAQARVARALRGTREAG
jgi:hypothetical protein